jgi:hypothetical protein
MATKQQLEKALDDMVALVKAAEVAEGVLRELHQDDEAAELAAALQPFDFGTTFHSPVQPGPDCNVCDDERAIMDPMGGYDACPACG